MSFSLYVCVLALARCVAISIFSKTSCRYYKSIGVCNCNAGTGYQMSLSLYVCVWALARCVAISSFSKTSCRYYKSIGACTCNDGTCRTLKAHTRLHKYNFSMQNGSWSIASLMFFLCKENSSHNTAIHNSSCSLLVEKIAKTIQTTNRPLSSLILARFLTKLLTKKTASKTILKPSSNRSLFKLIFSDQTLIKLK